jgi:hypothetical protein
MFSFLNERDEKKKPFRMMPQEDQFCRNSSWMISLACHLATRGAVLVKVGVVGIDRVHLPYKSWRVQVDTDGLAGDLS